MCLKIHVLDWMSSCPSTVYWKDSSLSTELPLRHTEIAFVPLLKISWLDTCSSIFGLSCSIDPCDCAFTNISLSWLLSGFFFKIIYLFLEGREREREGEKHWCEKHQLVASSMCPDWGPNPQPRPGIELATFRFAGQCQPTELHQSGLDYSALQ